MLNTHESIMHIASQDDDETVAPSLVGDDLRQFRRNQREETKGNKKFKFKFPYLFHFIEGSFFGISTESVD